MTTPTAQDVARAATTAVTGKWYRHCPAKFAREALSGWRANGRWGTKDGFPVLYLGQPVDAVVIEAYRHLIDPIEGPVPPLAPRVLVTCSVDVDRVLDLTSASAHWSVGLSLEVLRSATTDVLAYERCREVAQVAHQLGLTGVTAPAAGGVGAALALFPDRLAAAEQPVRTADDVMWTSLPPDPRQAPARPQLRIARANDLDG